MEANKFLQKEAVKKLKKLQVSHDIEAAHIDADDVLCELLTELGYSEVVSEYEQVYKWYA